MPPEVIFDQGLGDLFVVRVAGNIADDAVIGSIEYAAAHLGTSLVMVLGHESCGAVDAAVHDNQEAHIATLAKAIKPAVEAAKQTGDNLTPEELLDRTVRENVRLVRGQLTNSCPILADLIAQNRLRIVGGYYDLHTGGVSLIE